MCFVDALLLLYRQECPFEVFDLLWRCGCFTPGTVWHCFCRWTAGRLHACHTFTINGARLHCIRFIALKSASTFTAPTYKTLDQLWQIFIVRFAKLSLVLTLTSGDFPVLRQAAGMYSSGVLLSGPDEVQPSRLHSPWPGPNPSTSAVSWLSRPSACQQLWENVLHIMTMQKACQESDLTHMCRYVTFWAQQQLLKNTDPILSCFHLSSVTSTQSWATLI